MQDATPIRPLYLSPTGRGGVDFGIQNIVRAVRQHGAPDAELRPLAERFNFAPFLIPGALPAGWWRPFDVIQGRSRVAFALRAPGRPLVTTVHHLTTDPALQPYSTPAQRLFYRLVERRYDGWSIRDADAVVCVSAYTRRQVAETYGRQDTELIYDGIDTDVFVPPPDGRRRDALPELRGQVRLLFVGNRTRRKGFDLLPAIMDALPAEYVLYYTSGFQGRSPAQPPHRRMIPLGAPDRAGLVAAYQSCDILLFPSRLEGFGIAPAEALACGLPVVTTHAGALPEVVDDGTSGFLCPRDDVAAYAARVRELGEDAALRRRFGAFGREKVVATFGYAPLGRSFVALYRRLRGRMR
ncbi:MAG: glycosyltransferase family 4 protein [Chloroflexi bacterium]|nr:glycosyltransferase family 4 protein [Chloroflexota bacterium]